MQNNQRLLSISNKYKITANLLSSHNGTLLDIGSRDCKLKSFLNGESIHYHSADVAAGCDYVVDLENPLCFTDRQFDYVVALDVLEHVENIHTAFSELLRVTRKSAIIALPNMASFIHRNSFLWTGRLSTDKYDLLTKHQGDRHRWLTTYSQIDNFVLSNIKNSDFNIQRIIEEVEGKSLSRLFSYSCLKTGLPCNSFMVTRIIYLLNRNISSVQ